MTGKVDSRQRLNKRQFIQGGGALAALSELPDKAPSIVRGWDKARNEFAFDKYHFITKPNSLQELARWAGIDGADLVAPVDSYNQAQSAGRDSALGRQHMPLPLTRGPYYGIRMQGTQSLTFAGLAIDTNLGVIREDGSPIENLYGAGEVIGAGATTGNAIVNGMALTPALTFGPMIGNTAPVAA